MEKRTFKELCFTLNSGIPLVFLVLYVMKNKNRNNTEQVFWALASKNFKKATEFCSELYWINSSFW